jgi:hypothetical protein
MYVLTCPNLTRSDIMSRPSSDLLDLSGLTASDRREIRDLYQFLLTCRTATRKPDATYCFSDLCGTMN